MKEAIKVVEVSQVGDSAIVVTFSDGRRAQYSAATLSSMGEATQRPIAFRDRFWARDLE